MVSDRLQHRLTIVPCFKDEAAAFVKSVHRHHGPRIVTLFCQAVADEAGKIRGVSQVGTPTGPGAGWNDGWTVEVYRVATDGCPNACSALYAAAARVAIRGLGYRRVVTYSLPSESGSSLRAAGYRIIAERPARSWADSSRARPRIDTNTVVDQQKLVWERVA